MIRVLLHLCLACGLYACMGASDGAAPRRLQRDAACREQADAWCDHVGFADSAGCRTWYLHECEPNGPTGTIASAAQDACLDAIATSTANTEPSACRETWRYP